MFWISPKPGFIELKNSIIHTFIACGTGEAIEIPHDDLLILAFQKDGINESCFFKENNNWIFGTGTFVYDLQFGNAALEAILNNYIKNNFDDSSLTGNFALIICVDGKLIVLSDPIGLSAIYLNQQQKIISSSLLAVVRHAKTKYAINKMAAIELLTTGTISGKETVFQNIEKYSTEETVSFNNVTIIKTAPAFEKPLPYKKGITKAIDDVVEMLDEVFKNYAGLVNNYGADTSLTGGLDSRLVLAFALRNWNKDAINCYTNSRIKKDGTKIIDEKLASLVAGAVDVPLKFGWMRHPADLQEEELMDILTDSYNLSHGQCGMHVQFFEEYNTKKFKTNLLAQHKVNVSGIGGEMLRNYEGLTRKYFPKHDYFKYRHILLVSGDCFKDNATLNALTDHVVAKFDAKLNLHSSTLSMLDIKRNYIYFTVPNRLAFRNVSENQFCWFISPLADQRLIERAEEVQNYLGYAQEFETAIIKRVNPKLAGIMLDYGFTPNAGVPLKNKLKNIVRDTIPMQLFYNNYIKPLSKKPYSFAESMKKFTIITKALETVESLQLPLDIAAVCRKPDLFPIAVNLGFLLLKEKEHISL